MIVCAVGARAAEWGELMRCKRSEGEGQHLNFKPDVHIKVSFD